MRIASAIGAGGIPLIDSHTQLETISGNYFDIQEKTNNFVADYFVNHWADSFPEYECACCTAKKIPSNFPKTR
jgi:hypothetical protein